MSILYPEKILKAWDDLLTIEKTDTFQLLKNRITKYKEPKVLDIGAGGEKTKVSHRINGCEIKL